MAIISSGDTNIGMKRTTNQDSICLLPESNLFIVADGMGGHNGGDIASQMSTDLLAKFVTENSEEKSSGELLVRSVEQVNDAIYFHGQENEELRGMGTTVTGLMIDGEDTLVVNVGDSRTYLISQNKLFQLSRDHSLVQEKINLGIYTRDEGHKDPQKNVLVRTVGFDPDVNVDLIKYKLHKNDLFLICSDGLHGKVSDEDIIYTVNKFIPHPQDSVQEDLDLLVSELIKQANDNGGNDNISVIVLINQ